MDVLELVEEWKKLSKEEKDRFSVLINSSSSNEEVMESEKEIVSIFRDHGLFDDYYEESGSSLDFNLTDEEVERLGIEVVYAVKDSVYVIKETGEDIPFSELESDKQEDILNIIKEVYE